MRVTIGGHTEDQQVDDARTIIRAFWLTEIKHLREVHDQGRLANNLGPISNREIARLTGIAESSLSDMLNCRFDVVHDWDTKVGPVVEVLGGSSREWVHKWRRARAAYDSLSKTEPAAITESPNAIENSPPQESTTGSPEQKPAGKRPWLIPAAIGGALAAGAGIWLLVAPGSDTEGYDPATQPAPGNTAARCEQVRDRTETVSVFKDPKGYERWTQWRGGTRFRGEVDASNPNRYRVLLNNGQYGYVNRDSTYIASAKDCP